MKVTAILTEVIVAEAPVQTTVMGGVVLVTVTGGHNQKFTTNKK